MAASPSCLDNFRPENRAKLGSTSRCHRLLWACSCLLIGLVSCTIPRPIVISECSAGSADIVAPTDDQFKVDPYGTFSWPASAGATAYMLTAGTQAGITDVWTGMIYHGTSARIPVLQPFTTYYLQLAAQVGSQCTVTRTSFSTGAGLAHLTTPAEGAAEVDPAVSFAWNGVVDAEMFQLQLSKEAPGANEAYDSGELPNITSLAHPDLLPNTQNYHRVGGLKTPVLSPNTIYFARLVTRKRGTPFFADSTFSTGYGTAHLTSPSDGMGGVGSQPIFMWNRSLDSAVGHSYRLDLGTAPGLADFWSSGWIAGERTQARGAVFAPETVYYARLWTRGKGSATHSDSAFSTGSFHDSIPAASRFLYLADYQRNVDPLKPIVWSSVEGASYTLRIGDGTTLGVDDRNRGWTSRTTHTSWAGGLTGGKTYFATLTTFSTSPSPCSTASPCQSTQRIKFTASSPPMPHSVEAFNATVTAATASVRNMADARNVPFPQTFLVNNWDDQMGVAVCADFANNLAVQLQNVGIVARRRDSIFGFGPLLHSMVGYHNPVRGAWESADATYGMVFSDPAASPPGMNLYEIAKTLDRGNPASIPVQFVTAASVTQDCPECFGDYWVRTSVVDPMILYLNPTNDELGPSIRNDPSKFLVEYSGATGVVGTYIFRFQSQSDSVVVQDGGGAQYLLTPSSLVTGGANYSHELRPSEGWFYATPPPAGLKVFKFVCPVFDNIACH